MTRRLGSAATVPRQPGASNARMRSRAQIPSECLTRTQRHTFDEQRSFYLNLNKTGSGTKSNHVIPMYVGTMM